MYFIKKRILYNSTLNAKNQLCEVELTKAPLPDTFPSQLMILFHFEDPESPDTTATSKGILLDGFYFFF